MSLRTYIFTLLTGLVLLIAIALSYQSGRLFIGTLDMSITNVMLDIGRQYPEKGKVEQVVLGFHVTTDWRKVPQPIRDNFQQIPSEKNVNHSILKDWIYITPPKKAYSLMVVEQAHNQVFVSRFNEHIHEDIAKDQKHSNFFLNPIVTVILVGLFVIVVFVMTLLTIFKKIAVPVESLQQWAKNLTIDDLEATRPDFRFKELNGLAHLIHQNLVSVAASIKREQTFLSYASHELRTPIAVLRSNTALLEKINPNPSSKERMVRDRIERASLTMKSMTETLLWLSREGDTEMPVEPVCLGELVDTIQQELIYLLAGKSVEVNLSFDESVVDLPLTPCVIVLNNLIRNAFQHTQQGHVDIVQQANAVIITNIETDLVDTDPSKNELGFGLGMQLVEKLTTQFGWRFSTHEMEQGYQVSISFDY